MTQKLAIDRPVVVEGRYDREKLMRVIDAQIVTTGGFSVFSSGEKRMLITRLAEKNGIIVLTDSDGAGKVIRNYFRSILPKDKLINLYIPQIEGREKRKKAPSKEGYLGVEGMDEKLLYDLFLPFASGGSGTDVRGGITKTDLYLAGLCGGDKSAAKRDAVAKAAALPSGMSSAALLEALNLLYSRDKALEMINGDYDG
ncbi:MAG: DUF4093 domain-containing protein [Clostridia bacterium]|nr:DUF4093 domain-containing protein [Clostridia bacterium]